MPQKAGGNGGKEKNMALESTGLPGSIAIMAASEAYPKGKRYTVHSVLPNVNEEQVSTFVEAFGTMVDGEVDMGNIKVSEVKKFSNI